MERILAEGQSRNQQLHDQLVQQLVQTLNNSLCNRLDKVLREEMKKIVPQSECRCAKLKILTVLFVNVQYSKERSALFFFFCPCDMAGKRTFFLCLCRALVDLFLLCSHIEESRTCDWPDEQHHRCQVNRSRRNTERKCHQSC